MNTKKGNEARFCREEVCVGEDWMPPNLAFASQSYHSISNSNKGSQKGSTNQPLLLAIGLRASRKLYLLERTPQDRVIWPQAEMELLHGACFLSARPSCPGSATELKESTSWFLPLPGKRVAAGLFLDFCDVDGASYPGSHFHGPLLVEFSPAKETLVRLQ